MTIHLGTLESQGPLRDGAALRAQAGGGAATGWDHWSAAWWIFRSVLRR
jgi:hypothetical protein